MVRRWFIRGLALTLLALCVVAWVGSYWQHVWTTYVVRLHDPTFQVLCGSFVCGMSNDPVFASGVWVWSHRPAKREDFLRAYQKTTHHFAGFVVDWPHLEPADHQFHPFWLLVIPLWAPTLLSALLLWFLWRKTKPKDVGRAFPVEIAATTPEKSAP